VQVLRSSEDRHKLSTRQPQRKLSLTEDDELYRDAQCSCEVEQRRYVGLDVSSTWAMRLELAPFAHAVSGRF